MFIINGTTALRAFPLHCGLKQLESLVDAHLLESVAEYQLNAL